MNKVKTLTLRITLMQIIPTSKIAKHYSCCQTTHKLCHLPINSVFRKLRLWSDIRNWSLLGISTQLCDGLEWPGWVPILFQTHRYSGGKGDKGRTGEGKQKGEILSYKLEHICNVPITNKGFISSFIKNPQNHKGKDEQLKWTTGKKDVISQNKNTQWPLGMKGCSISLIVREVHLKTREIHHITGTRQANPGSQRTASADEEYITLKGAFRRVLWGALGRKFRSWLCPRSYACPRAQ